jgi:hypothetical protein
MKWISLIAPVLFLSACGYINTETIAYRQVLVTPVPEDTYTVVDYSPVDVTDTMIEFY